VDADPFPWADRPSPPTRSETSVPADHASAERDSTAGVVVADASVWALCGLIFASVATRRPDVGGRLGDTAGNRP
jgi:hypothetical protein